MSIIDAQLVSIEISTLAGDTHVVVPVDRQRPRKSELRLNYHGQRYNLVQAFTSHKLERVEQRWQQLRAVDINNVSIPDRYLVVREDDYYSLWELNLGLNPVRENAGSNHLIELQQASIWLLQELWLQWQDLLGETQVSIFADNLSTVNSQIQSRIALDRLLSIDPLTTTKLASWSESDFIAFDRQLYHLTQKKIGQQFGTKLTIEIIQSMPTPLRSILEDILGI